MSRSPLRRVFDVGHRKQAASSCRGTASRSDEAPVAAGDLNAAGSEVCRSVPRRSASASRGGCDEEQRSSAASPVVGSLRPFGLRAEAHHRGPGQSRTCVGPVRPTIPPNPGFLAAHSSHAETGRRASHGASGPPRILRRFRGRPHPLLRFGQHHGVSNAFRPDPSEGALLMSGLDPTRRPTTTSATPSGSKRRSSRSSGSSSARTAWSSGRWSACSPAATASSKACPASPRRLTVSTLARVVGGSFARLQFTPDLVPADIVGTRIWRPSREEFDIEWGPVFANLVLADEINRARQGAVRAARGDGRAAGVDRRPDPPAADAVPRARHPEPDRVRRRVRAARRRSATAS